MTAAAADRNSLDFDKLLSDAMSAEQDRANDYANDLDSMINGDSASEQEKLNSENLSKILTNIRDHGPAYDSVKGHQESVEKVPDGNVEQAHSVAEDERQELLSRIHDDVLHTVNADTSGRMVWQISTLLLLVTLLGMITLFQYRTDDNLMQISHDLEQASEDYIEKLVSLKTAGSNESVSSGDSQQEVRELEVMVSQLNEEMQMLNNRLDEIGSQQQVESRNLMSMIEQQITPRLEKLAATEAAIATAASSIVTTNIKLADGMGAPSVENSGEKSAPHKATGWMVNLGTFVDRVKVERARESLTAAGQTALVHEATIDGKKAFRLAVGGFMDRHEAEVFRSGRARELGYENTWIRRE